MYYPPSQEEVSARLAKSKLTKFDTPFAADIANMASGGDVLPEVRWAPHYEQVAASKVEGRRGESPAAREGRASKVRDSVLADARASAAFLESADLARAPRVSPLAKAELVMRYLAQKASQEGKSPGNGERPGEDDNERGEGSAETPLAGCSEEEGAKLGRDVQDMLDFFEEAPDAVLDVLQEGEQGGQVDQVFPPTKADLAELLSVAKILTRSPLLAANKQRTIKESPLGKQKTVRPLVRMRDLRNITPRSRMMLATGAVGRAQLARGGLGYDLKFDWEDRKTKLYALLDQSGSMDHPRRIGAAMGCLHVLAAAVHEEKAELWYRAFDTRCTRLQKFEKPEAARVWLQSSLRNAKFRGGGTDISGAVSTALKDLAGVAQKDRPELLLITDGGSRISFGLAELGSVKLHLVQIGGERNDALRDLVLANRGLYLEVNA
jgi:uncharacterized protein with von Willebrand factor type A (vWA) domain